MSMSKMVLCSSWFSDRAWRVFEDDVIKIIRNRKTTRGLRRCKSKNINIPWL